LITDPIVDPIVDPFELIPPFPTIELEISENKTKN
jgi:hypothetical protein